MATIAVQTRSKQGVKKFSGPFLLLSIVVALLCLIGLMMVLSSSEVRSYAAFHDSWRYFKKQMIWLVAGSGLAIICSRVPYQWWRKMSLPLMGGSALMLLAVLVPGVGVSAGGAQRWLGVGSLVIQPSEIAKFAVIIYCADILARRAEKINDWKLTLRPVLGGIGLIAVLVIMQPDMGTMMMIAGIGTALLFVAGVSWPVMLALATSGVLGALFLGLVEGYRRARFVAFIDPWKDPAKVGYQNVQSLVGLGTGRIWGVGLGASRAKWGFLPNAFTDFIYAIIGEEFGFVGAALVLSLFVVFAFVGVKIARRAPDRFGMLVATGITAWIVGQAFLNIGAVMGVLPITGVPLPFVSFGGSSLVILLACTGVLLNIASQGSARNEIVAPRI